ncbi:hypothetical protein SK128_007412, partial [Halocaridina rubra]
VRTGVTNKAVLSYSAILQAGGGGGNSVTNKDCTLQSQPVLLQGATPTAVKNASLPKGAPATISIITGKGNKQGATAVTNSNPVNMLSVNLAQSKPNMINLKISNGQIQADGLHQVDVLREARPLASNTKSLDERKEQFSPAMAITVVTAPSHTTITGPVSTSMAVPKSPELETSPSRQASSVLTPKYSTVVNKQTDEESLCEVTDGLRLPLTGGKSSHVKFCGDAADEGRENGLEVLLPEDIKTSESTQQIITSVLHPLASSNQSSLPLPLNNKFQFTTTSASHAVATTKYSFVTMQSPMQNPLTPNVSPLFMNAQHALSMHNHSVITNASTKEGEYLNLECDEKIKEEPGEEEENMIQEIRQEALGPFGPRSPENFNSAHQDGFHNSYNNNNNNNNNNNIGIDCEIKDEKNIVEKETSSNIKVEDEEKSGLLVSSSDDVKPELVKFSDLLKWENGVGKLSGSNLKFRMNEFNAVEIVEDKDLEEIKFHHNNK